MTTNRGAYQQYNQVQIQTANRGKLIVMLYQGAIRKMKKALMMIEKKDLEGKGNCLIQAQDIILELLYALDRQLLESGNELAINLQKLYFYAYRRLIEANTKIDRQAVEEVVELMSSLLVAWQQVAGGKDGDQSDPVETAGVALTG